MKKKKKIKEIQNVIGGEGAMKAIWRQKGSGLEKKIEKKMKLVVKKMKTKMNKDDGKNKWFLK